MLKRNLFFTCLLLVLWISPSLAFTNLIANPSFENGFEGWAKYGPPGLDYTVGTSVVHTGNNALACSNYSGSGRVLLAIPTSTDIVPGTCYVGTAWVKVENMTQGKVFIGMDAYGGDLLRRFDYFQGTFPIEGDTDWQQLFGSAVMPAGTGTVYVIVYLEDLNPEAKVYIDDAALFKLPQNTAMLRNTLYIPGKTTMRMRMPGALGDWGISFLPNIDAWNNAMFQMPIDGLFGPGKYAVWVHYWGSPQSADVDQTIKPIYWSTAANDLVWADGVTCALPAETDGQGHFVNGSLEFDQHDLCGFILQNTFQGTTDGSTNIVDWIWVGPEGSQPPESELMVNSAPGNLAAVYDGPGTVKLTWQQPNSGSGISVYEIYRGTSANFPLAEGVLVGSTSSTTFVGTLDSSHELNYFKVVAWNGIYSHRSPASEVNIKSDNIPPQVPQNLRASSSGNVELKWNPPLASPIDGDLAAGYHIWRAQGETPFGQTPHAVIAKTDSAFTNDPNGELVWKDRNVVAGQIYRYAISAVDENGNEGPLTAPISVTVAEDKTLPLEPEPIPEKNALGLDVEKILGAVIVQWLAPGSAPDGDLAEEFVVYRSIEPDPENAWQTDGGARWIIEANPISSGSKQEFVDTTVIPGKTYYYAVASLDKARNQSAALVGSQGVIPQASYCASPLSPNEGAAVANSAPTFSWGQPQAYANDTIRGYYLELAKDSSFTEEYFQSELTTQTSYKLGDALAPGNWYWRVVVVYQSGVENASTTVAFKSISNTEGLNVAFLNVSSKVFAPKDGTLSINYVLQEDGCVTLRLYDFEGRLVKTFCENAFHEAKDESGQFQNWHLTWDGTDRSGRLLPRGIYILHLELRTTSRRPATMSTRLQMVR